MSSAKAEYLRDLDKFIIEPIFVGNGISDFEREISENMLAISISFEIAKECKVTDFLDFFERLIQNRRKQLEAYPDRRMLFYVWFDEQAAQLRLSLISAEHKVPPFGAEIRLAALDEIITDFLRSKYLAGIPLSEFSIADPESETREPFDLILKVYYILIKHDIM